MPTVEVRTRVQNWHSSDGLPQASPPQEETAASEKKDCGSGTIVDWPEEMPELQKREQHPESDPERCPDLGSFLNHHARGQSQAKHRRADHEPRKEDLHLCRDGNARHAGL